MIEVIYKEEKQEAKGNEGMFAIPRNIRQIGLSSEDYRIYVEDYVYTFLVRLAGTDTSGENEKGHLAVLTGESKWQSGVTYVFVRGALTVDKTEAAADHIDFSEKVWSKIHDEQELYFSGQEIVGWFFAQPELPLEITEVFQRVHLKHFGGGEKVLMLMDPAEREDAFFRYENNFLVRQPGYYLFYEKNPLMQNYMLDKKQEIHTDQAEEVQDEAVVAFRKIIRSKKKIRREERTEKMAASEGMQEEERPSVFSYAATACLAIAVLAVGVNFYRNYQSGYRLEQQIRTTSATVKETSEEEVTKIPEKDVTPTGAAEKENKIQLTQFPAESTDGKGGNGETDLQKEAELQKESGQESGKTASIGTEETVTEKSNNIGQEEGSTQTSTSAGENNGNASSDNGGNRTNQNVSDQDSGTVPEQDAGNQQEEEQIYQQESDVRKAKRKQEQANQAVSGDSVHTSYVIRPGDTLYQISIEKYGSMDAISEICRLNGLTEEEIIYPGQIIVLP